MNSVILTGKLFRDWLLTNNQTTSWQVNQAMFYFKGQITKEVSNHAWLRVCNVSQKHSCSFSHENFKHWLIHVCAVAFSPSISPSPSPSLSPSQVLPIQLPSRDGPHHELVSVHPLIRWLAQWCLLFLWAARHDTVKSKLPAKELKLIKQKCDVIFLVA